MSGAAAPPAVDWRDGFLFLGNQLALDFLNTRPVLNGEFVELLPCFKALLRWFQAAELISARDAASFQQQWGESRRGLRVVEAARHFRERLRDEVLAWEGGAALRRSTIDELNRLMAEHPMRTKLKASRHGVVKEQCVEHTHAEDLLAPLADSAAALFSEVSRGRVRKCGQCVLHFLDTSKKGTRRWCSMQFCGNRVKVAAYAARRRMR